MFLLILLFSYFMCTCERNQFMCWRYW